MRKKKKELKDEELTPEMQELLEKVKRKVDQDIADAGGFIPFMAKAMVDDYMKTPEGKAKMDDLKKNFNALFRNSDGEDQR